MSEKKIVGYGLVNAVQYDGRQFSDVPVLSATQLIVSAITAGTITLMYGEDITPHWALPTQEGEEPVFVYPLEYILVWDDGTFSKTTAKEFTNQDLPFTAEREKEIYANGEARIIKLVNDILNSNPAEWGAALDVKATDFFCKILAHLYNDNVTEIRHPLSFSVPDVFGRELNISQLEWGVERLHPTMTLSTGLLNRWYSQVRP